MSSGTLSILGLYNYGAINDDDLFENLSLPEGIEKSDVVDNILEQCAEFETIYSDYDYMKFSIGLWSKRWYWTFEKWITLLEKEYEPLWNFDRKEDYTDTESETIDKDTTDRRTQAEQTTAEGESETVGHTETSDTVDETDTNSVVAYNSDTLHLKEQDVIDRDGTSESDDTINSTASTEENRSLTDNATGTEDTSRERTFDHTAWLRGNIGTMSSQELFMREVDVARFNLIQQIVDCFKVDMCILVY